MKRVLIGCGLALWLVLSGCATTKPIWFIATPGYVEVQIATSEEATRQEYEAEIAQLQGDIDQQRAAAEELAVLASVIAEIESSNRALLDLADELEGRLAALPQDTIRELVNVLQIYLEEEAGQ